MSKTPDTKGFSAGQTAEDFANFVKESLNDHETDTVVVPFEDFTLPDAIVFGESTEIAGTEISYVQLFGGALEHFHGIRITNFSAVPLSGKLMTPYSMGLQLVIERPQ